MVRSTTHAAAVLNGQDSESDGDTGKGREEKEVASLLDRLRSPTPTDIARSRKIRRSGVISLPALPAESERTEEPLRPSQKGVTPRQQVKEFPTEPFTVCYGQLFCSACREQLSLKRSILKNHVESLKHRNSKDRLACGNNWIFNWI